MRLSLSVVEKPNGYVVWEGKSRLTGAPVVLIATGLQAASANGKTGAMVQTFILGADMDPVTAIDTGDDAAVCGDCIHRKVNGAGSCYVNTGQGPLQVYLAWKRGSYPRITPAAAGALVSGLLLRCGAYGDPVAVPVHVWEQLLGTVAGHTGYTHQWRRKLAQPYRRFLMASVDTAKQAERASKMGWRYFRVSEKDGQTLPKEIHCPASEEAGKRLTCETCGACDGAGNNPGRVNIVIDAHGLAWKIDRFRQAQHLMKQRKRFRVTEWTVKKGVWRKR